MVLIDDFSEEKECVYKEEHYRVRDNGAVMRLQIQGKKCRSLDNVWTFGSKNKKTGYKTIGGHRVHIIVATAFHGEHNSKVFVVDHIDTNRSNNRADNLRWLTRLENILLNPITRTKVEYICGSIENFLSNPTLLRGHEMKDRNFEWMRAVTKEEAEKNLRNWNYLMGRPRHTLTNEGGLGDWIISGNLKWKSVKEAKPSSLPVIANEVITNKSINTDIIKRRRQKIEQIKKEKREKRPKAAIHRQVIMEEKCLYIKSVRIRFVPHTCYCCGTKHFTFFVIGMNSAEDPTLSTYEEMNNTNAQFDEFAPILIDGVKKYLAEHSNLKYKMGEIKKRYSRTINDSYMSFGCPHCDSIVGNHYLQINNLDYVYEPDDEFVHTIDLEEPGLKVNVEYRKDTL